MKGQVLKFNFQESQGMIVGENGQQYIFFASQWQSNTMPTQGDIVEFTVDTLDNLISVQVQPPLNTQSQNSLNNQSSFNNQSQNPMGNPNDFAYQQQNQFNNQPDFNHQPQNPMGNPNDFAYQQQNQFNNQPDFNHQPQNPMGNPNDFAYQQQNQFNNQPDFNHQPQNPMGNPNDFAYQQQNQFNNPNMYQNQNNFGGQNFINNPNNFNTANPYQAPMQPMVINTPQVLLEQNYNTMDWIKKCLQNYTSFKGRARRKEYWWFYLFTLIVYIVTSTMDAMAGTEYLFTGLASLALFLPTLAVTVRRLHDIGRSGWWIFISIIPLIGVFILIFWLATNTQPLQNQWGNPAKPI